MDRVHWTDGQITIDKREQPLAKRKEVLVQRAIDFQRSSYISEVLEIHIISISRKQLLV